MPIIAAAVNRKTTVSLFVPYNVMLSGVAKPRRAQLVVMENSLI